MFSCFFLSCVEENKPLDNSYDLSAKVIYLKDGDSFVVLDENKKEVEVRMLDIDAPELHQDFGKKAKTYLSNLIKGKTVGLDYEGHDKYGRILADVYLDTLFLNEHMITEGLAWHYSVFSTDENFMKLENQAHEAKKGLWQNTNPTAPWVWRAHHKR